MKKFFKSIWDFITGVEQPTTPSDNTYEVSKPEEPKHIIVEQPVVEETPKQEVVYPGKQLDIKFITPEQATEAPAKKRKPARKKKIDKK